MSKFFFAYPYNPPSIGQTIEAASNFAKQRGIDIETWQEVDIPGQFIASEIMSKIEECDILCADVTILNFNVAFEIGYAIAKGKRIFITKNKTYEEIPPVIKDVGIFDTIGYSEYENSKELSVGLSGVSPGKKLSIPQSQNLRAPIYLLETRYRSDHQIRLVSRVKKAGYIYRSFDPNESARLSASSALDGVGQSYGVVVPLLPFSLEGSAVHNIRASFIAGVAMGLNRALLVIQTDASPVPLDYRDFACICFHPNEIDEAVANFAAKVNSCIQQGNDSVSLEQETLLEKVNLGASSAENEMRYLDSYYIKTDAYMKAKRGEVNLVVGRKGSGKSAIFLRLRDEQRRNKKNIVLDLQPDGYKLLKFKESVLKNLEKGTFQHTITVFWEYVLLLEICHKIIQQDRDLHLRNNQIFEPYRTLSELYKSDEYVGEGDFSERISSLMDSIVNEYQRAFGNEKNVSLLTPQVTELIYRHDLHKLLSALTQYLKFKDELWVLFDNLDKGWPTTGLEETDLVIIRTLIDATRKLQREMNKVEVNAFFIIFLRSDVFQLLVHDTSDRGKEASVIVDWTDSDLLRQMLKLRINTSATELNGDFGKVWPKIFVSHVKGEESSQYLIDRCLMRPRFLIDLVNQCKSFAINLNHKIVEETDIQKGVESFSNDILSDISYEVRDISADYGDIMYNFIGSKPFLSKEDLRTALQNLSDAEFEKVIDIFLWYGFLGIATNDDKELYIYNLNYNFKMLKSLLKSNTSTISGFSINPAFWRGLMVGEL